MFPALPKDRYSVILCDPPWDYGENRTQHNGKGGKSTGGAVSHYPTVTTDDLKGLDIGSICEPDCLLFMWVTNPHLDQGLDLLKAWGFQYATVAFVWDKQRVNPGFYTMSQCELCIVGKRGKIPTPRGSRNERQFVSAMRGTHSAKPAEVRARIERMFPAHKKLELFARERVPGWSSWGNEI